jgi:hypothetical protein
MLNAFVLHPLLQSSFMQLLDQEVLLMAALHYAEASKRAPYTAVKKLSLWLVPLLWYEKAHARGIRLPSYLLDLIEPVNLTPLAQDLKQASIELDAEAMTDTSKRLVQKTACATLVTVWFNAW